MAPGGWDRCPAALGPYLRAVTSAVAFIRVTLEEKGECHIKIAFYYSGSQGAMLYLSEAHKACCFSSFLQLNISVTNVSVCGTTFGLLSPKWSSVAEMSYLV